MKPIITKILALALAMLMVFAMVGCHTGNDYDNDDTANPPEYNLTDIMPFPIDYKVWTDAKSINLGDILTITVSLKTADLADIDATLEISKNDSYEIIGEERYFTGDLVKDEEYAQLTFKIRITKENYIAEKILFTFAHDSCNTIKEGESLKDTLANLESCRFCSYSNNFSITGGTGSGATSKSNLYINSLGFVADSQGVIISKDFEQSKDNAPENLVDIMTESLNREYAAGVSLEELIGRIIEFENCGKVFFDRFDSDKLVYTGSSKTEKTYLSKNLRVRVLLPDEKCKDSYPELYDRFCLKGNENELAEDILLVLLEREMISQAHYDAELAYLKANGIAKRIKVAAVEDYNGNGTVNGDSIIIVPGGSISGSTNSDHVTTIPGTGDTVSSETVIFTIHKEGTYIVKSYNIDYSELEFSFPKGDDFYHYILDLRNPL